MRDAGAMRSQRTIHLLFEVGLWLKGLFALSETIAGIAAYFVSQHSLLRILQWPTMQEFSEGSHDIVANSLFHTIQNLSVSTQKFAALYLFGHGAIKLWLIVGLLRARLWYYPVAMIVFALFIAYQLYRYTLTHSVWLLLITILDLIVIVLTWLEYRLFETRVATT
jgi:uncharacterized membrane protein